MYPGHGGDPSSWRGVCRGRAKSMREEVHHHACSRGCSGLILECHVQIGARSDDLGNIAEGARERGGHRFAPVGRSNRTCVLQTRRSRTRRVRITS